MIRLLLLLIAGIAATMYFADNIIASLPTDAPEARQAAAASQTEAAPGKTLSQAALEIIENTAPVRPERPRSAASETANMVPFTKPMVVGPDGKLQEPAVPVAEAEPVEQQVTQETDQPLVAVLYVSAERVNVRGGPSTNDPVVGSVEFAEAVQVLSDPAEPWVLIRIEGDGIEGFMASRFLTQTEPQG